jgi:Xanthomonas XOO_2897-like deaminase
MSLHEISTEAWPAEAEINIDHIKHRLKHRVAELSLILRALGWVPPKPDPYDLPKRPPVVEVDPDRRRRRRGGQVGPPPGGQGGSREDELAGLPEAWVMERLGQLAATTPNEAEAEAFVGALPTLAATLVPTAAPALVRAAPDMVSGLSTAASLLRQGRATRNLVQWLPTVARRTALRVGHQAARGRLVTPDICTRILADTAVQVLSKAALEAEIRARLPLAVAKRQERRQPALATRTKRFGRQSKKRPTPAPPLTTRFGGAAGPSRADAARRILATMRPPRWHRYGRTTAPIDRRLLELAMEARATQAGVSDTAFRQNNVATARVRADGKVRYLSTGNTPGGGAHSEEWIDAQIHELSRGGRQVELEQLYTERIPCRGTCGPFLRGRYPNAGVYYTTAAATSSARVKELREAYGLRDSGSIG